MKLLFSTLLAISLSPIIHAKSTLDDALKNWAKRDDKNELSLALSKFETLHQAKPDQKDVLVYLTRAHFLLADSFSEKKEDKLKHFEKAYEYGEKALMLNDTYKKRVEKKEEPHFAVKDLGIEEVPQMYWTAASLGKFAKANGVMASLKHKSKILALIERVEQLNKNYFFAAVPRYWGSYYAALPAIMGGSLKKSKKYFQESMQASPEYVGTKVLFAEIYLVADGDEGEFKKVLEGVINDTTYDQHPEIGPENRLEKIKARSLLEQMKKLF